MYQTFSNLDKTEPHNVKKALSHPQWTQAIKDKIHTLHKNKIWTFVAPSLEMNIAGNHWIFKLKKNVDGSNKFKAGLVAKGFNQNPGIDYKETYSPIIKPSTIR